MIHQQSIGGQAPQAPTGSGASQMLNPTSPGQQSAAEVKQPNMPSPPKGADQVSSEIIQAQQQ